jgi:hypothetical protein
MLAKDISLVYTCYIRRKEMDDLLEVIAMAQSAGFRKEDGSGPYDYRKDPDFQNKADEERGENTRCAYPAF